MGVPPLLTTPRTWHGVTGNVIYRFIETGRDGPMPSTNIEMSIPCVEGTNFFWGGLFVCIL